MACELNNDFDIRAAPHNGQIMEAGSCEIFDVGCCILPYCPDGILNSSSHERPDGGWDQKVETRKW